jgi:SAM-dependent methyltransferase
LSYKKTTAQWKYKMREDLLNLPRIHRKVNSLELTPISESCLATIIQEIKQNANRLTDFPMLVTCEPLELDVCARAFNLKLALKGDWVASNRGIWSEFFPDPKSQENMTLAFGLEKTSGKVNEMITDMQPWLFRAVVMLSPTASDKLMPSLEKTDYWLDVTTSLFSYQLTQLNYRLNTSFSDTKVASTFLNRIKSDRDLEFFSLGSESAMTSWLKKIYSTDAEFCSLFEFKYSSSEKGKAENSEKRKNVENYLLYLIKAVKDKEKKEILNYFFQMGSPKTCEEYATILPRHNKNVPEIYEERCFKKAMAKNKQLLETLAQNLNLDSKAPNFRNEFSNPLSELSILYVEQEIVAHMQKAKILPIEANNFSGRALFVGEGLGKNMLAIQKAYPNLACYALEPDVLAVKQALAFGVRKNQQFHATMDLIPKACYGQFDLLFVLHYNIRFSQVDFFQRAFDLLKPNGKIIVGKAMSDPQHISSNSTIGELLKQTFTNFSLPGWTNGVPDLEFKQALYAATKTESKMQSLKDSAKQTPLEQWLNNKNSAEHKAMEKFMEQLNQEALAALNPTPKNSQALASLGLLSPRKPPESDEPSMSNLSKTF